MATGIAQEPGETPARGFLAAAGGSKTARMTENAHSRRVACAGVFGKRFARIRTIQDAARVPGNAAPRLCPILCSRRVFSHPKMGGSTVGTLVGTPFENA
jgi:hypothetical protein